MLLLLLLPAPARLAEAGQLGRRQVTSCLRPVAGRFGAGEDPGVLRAAALRAVDDHRALAQRHACQAAGNDLDLLADPEQREFALERLHELVVKPTGESGGKGVFIGPLASEEQLEAQRLLLAEAPERWIAQQTVALSTVPTALPDGSLAPRHVDLRPFAVFGDEIKIVPGGLTRVALREGSMIVNSSQGGGSKDTWVLAGDEAKGDGPPKRDELAPPRLPGLRQAGWRGQQQQQQQAQKVIKGLTPCWRG